MRTPRWSAGLGWALLLVSAAACRPEAIDPFDPPAPPTPDENGRRSRTFTTTTDFMAGELNGMNADTPGELQMSSGLALFDTPFIWIPNSTERTVTRIDTKTLENLGSFPLVGPSGEDCYNPSRTTVDIDGHVWVGCRGESSYINREQVSAGMVPVTVDNKVVKLSRDDGRVLLSLKVGHAPRALALDVHNHLWIGASVDDTIWEIDGVTGHCYRGELPECDNPAIAVEDFPYGIAVDQRGHLWVVHKRIPTNQPDLITEIDTETGQILGVYGPYLREGCDDLYGIAIHQLNNIWLGGFTCDDVVQIKGVSGVHPADGKYYEAGEMIDAYDIGGTVTRGLAIDLDGNVWAAASGTNTATKLNGITGEILEALNVGAQPIGIGVDAYGNAWAVNRGANSVHRINGLDVTLKREVPVGQGPYTYSDMLGMALRTITHRAEGFSTWKVKIDSQMDDPKWLSLHWTAQLPDNTRLSVRMRCAETEERLVTASWGGDLDAPGAADCGGPGGRWAEVEIRFYATNTTASPIFKDLTVYWE